MNWLETINYAELYELVKQEMEIPKQTAGTCSRKNRESDSLQNIRTIQKIQLAITKVNPPFLGADCDGAGVEVVLTNDKTL